MKYQYHENLLIVVRIKNSNWLENYNNEKEQERIEILKRRKKKKYLY